MNVSGCLNPTVVDALFSEILRDVVNDHLSDCFTDQILTKLRKMKAIMLQNPGLWKLSSRRTQSTKIRSCAFVASSCNAST